MTQTDKMLSRKEGGVGYMTFNNPERHNAVSLDMWEAAQGILADFAADKAVRVVVVTGAGGKIIYANDAYLTLAGARGPAELRKTWAGNLPQ